MLIDGSSVTVLMDVAVMKVQKVKKVPGVDMMENEELDDEKMDELAAQSSVPTTVPGLFFRWGSKQFAQVSNKSMSSSFYFTRYFGRSSRLKRRCKSQHHSANQSIALWPDHWMEHSSCSNSRLARK